MPDSACTELYLILIIKMLTIMYHQVLALYYRVIKEFIFPSRLAIFNSGDSMVLFIIFSLSLFCQATN